VAHGDARVPCLQVEEATGTIESGWIEKDGQRGVLLRKMSTWGVHRDCTSTLAIEIFYLLTCVLSVKAVMCLCM
jgi:hypothetical protein